jgi:hypothetical protein
VPTDEFIEFEIPTDGSKMDYQIWRDASLDKDLVKCDLCSEFVPDKETSRFYVIMTLVYLVVMYTA